MVGGGAFKLPQKTKSAGGPLKEGEHQTKVRKATVAAMKGGCDHM